MLYKTLHNNLCCGLIFQYNQEFNKTILLHNIKYTQSEHNTYTLIYSKLVQNKLYSLQNYIILQPYITYVIYYVIYNCM